MGSSRALRALVALAIVAAPTVALADPTPQQKELARDLMQKGRDARGTRDLKLALESFKAADDIMHVPTTGFEVARSQADLGLLVEAHETLLKVGRIPEQANEPKPFKDAREYARVLDQELLARIPTLKISVEGTSLDRLASVVVDGVSLPPASLVVPLKVDPGHHVVVAKAASAEGRREVDVSERESKDVVIALGAPKDGAAAAPSPAPAASPSAPPETTATTTLDAAPSSNSRFTTVTWIGFGVAAAGVAVGTVTGLMAFSDKSSLDSQCNGTRCPPSTHDSLSSASSVATISTVSFVVAGVGAGVGVASLLFGKGAPGPAPTTGVRVTPWIGLGGAGASGTF